MNLESYYYNCSPEYIHSIDPALMDDLQNIIQRLPKRQNQSEINCDLFWLLAEYDWNYDTLPQCVAEKAPDELGIKQPLGIIKERNRRNCCVTSTTLGTRLHSDFAKQIRNNFVQLEAQFGKVEAMFKDFCGFRMAYAERRLSLGIEIVLSDPNRFFAHRKRSIGGMVHFKIAKDTLNSIGLDCQIWLVRIKRFVI